MINFPVNLFRVSFSKWFFDSVFNGWEWLCLFFLPFHLCVIMQISCAVTNLTSNNFVSREKKNNIFRKLKAVQRIPLQIYFNFSQTICSHSLSFIYRFIIVHNNSNRMQNRFVNLSSFRSHFFFAVDFLILYFNHHADGKINHPTESGTGDREWKTTYLMQTTTEKKVICI